MALKIVKAGKVPAPEPVAAPAVKSRVRNRENKSQLTKATLKRMIVVASDAGMQIGGIACRPDGTVLVLAAGQLADLSVNEPALSAYDAWKKSRGEA